MTRKQLLDSMDSAELTQWAAYIPIHNYEETEGKDASVLYRD